MLHLWLFSILGYNQLFFFRKPSFLRALSILNVYIQQFVWFHSKDVANGRENVHVGTIKALFPIGYAGVAHADKLSKFLLAQPSLLSEFSYARAYFVFHKKPPHLFLYIILRNLLKSIFKKSKTS